MSKRRKKRGRPSKERKGGLKLRRETVLSILMIGSFLAAILIIISFSRRGTILVKVNDLLLFYFSWAAVFLPFLLISFSFLVSRFKTPLSSLNVFIGGLLFSVSLMSAGRAGFLGKYIWNGVASLITGLGAFVVLLGMAFVGFIILFNTSVDQVLYYLGLSLKMIRGILVGEREPQHALSNQGFKVSGVGVNQNEKNRQDDRHEKKEEFVHQPVSNDAGETKVWKYPSLSLLSDDGTGSADRGDIKGNASVIEKTLESFGITARVVEVNLGPAVTQYAIEVALGTKLSKITSLDRDMALALAAPTGAIRIEAPIPGRSLVGIELPNRAPEFVPLKKMLESEAMKTHKSKLAVSLGLDVSGKPIVSDLARMPHVLIAGQTGSGKSVCINAF